MRVRTRMSGAVFALFFAGIWTLVTSVFNIFILVSVMNQVRSSDFPQARGVVLSSEIGRHTGSKGGTTYSADITYTYVVDGTSYTCDRYAYGSFSSSSHSRAAKAVAAHPVGADVTVYYNPADPSDATLRTGIESGTLFIMIFMTPFNIIMLGSWIGVLGALRPRAKAPCAGFLRSDDGTRAVLGFAKLRPIYAAGIAMLVVSFVSIFVVGFTSGMDPSMAVVGGTWGAIVAGGVVGFMLQACRRRSARHRLVLDRTTQRLSLPRRGNTNEFAIHRSDDLGFEDIAAVETPVDHNRHKNNSVTYQLHLVPAMAGAAEPIVLARWLSETDARDAAQWLRKELGMASAPAHGVPGGLM